MTALCALLPFRSPSRKVAFGSRAPVAERTAIVSEGRIPDLQRSPPEGLEYAPKRSFRERETRFTAGSGVSNGLSIGCSTTLSGLNG
jgi:hypothetical protein